VFAFLADASTWPRWAIINVKAIAKADGEWWEMQTPGGSARLRIRAQEAPDILDHDFVTPEAKCQCQRELCRTGRAVSS